MTVAPTQRRAGERRPFEAHTEPRNDWDCYRPANSRLRGRAHRGRNDNSHPRHSSGYSSDYDRSRSASPPRGSDFMSRITYAGSSSTSENSSENLSLRGIYHAGIKKGYSGKLAPRMFKPEVISDEHMRKFHTGADCAAQFNLKLPYVRDMFRDMAERFDTVTAYTVEMLEPGDIVYFLQAHTIALQQDLGGPYVARVGGVWSTARIKLKGRFGIVVARYSQHVKVAEMSTFSGRGLAGSKPTRFWHEYVGIRDGEDKGYRHPSPHAPLEVARTCCDMMDDEGSVHLLTSTIGTSNQIMIAGRITDDSLQRLRGMVKDVEEGGMWDR